MTDNDSLSHVPEGPVPASRGGERLLDLVRVMARLRGPGGCPWDLEQDHRSLARHLLEETHEVLDAIDADDLDRLREELGDLLLQVVFHAQMAADDGKWDVDDVAEGIVTKLIRRHPHVFGDVEASSAGEVLRNWDQIKRGEEGREPGIFGDVPENLPAPLYARKLLRRASSAGAPLPPMPVEEHADAGDFESIGDLLLAVVARARELRVDPELALRSAADRFRDEIEKEADAASE